MAKSLSVAMQNALDAGHRLQVALFTFEFGTGTYGLWTAEGEKSFNGVIYRAGGSLIDITEFEESLDGSVSQLQLRLSALPDKELTDDVLLRFFDEDWHLKPVTVQLGLLDPATLEIIEVKTFFRGRLESASFEEDPGSAIVVECNSTSIELSQAHGNIRNGGTQRLYDATDKSMDEIGSLNGAISRDTKWGQA